MCILHSPLGWSYLNYMFRIQTYTKKHKLPAYNNKTVDVCVLPLKLKHRNDHVFFFLRINQHYKTNHVF